MKMGEVIKEIFLGLIRSKVPSFDTRFQIKFKQKSMGKCKIRLMKLQKLPKRTFVVRKTQ